MRGHVYRCPNCQTAVKVYNSCTDRHCPQCTGARRANWVEKTTKLLRPAVTYFQVVFTIPDTLSSLVLGNRRPLYRLLFRAAWSALRERVAKECDLEAAATMVLHTWNQRLQHHPHVHAIVPGCGPSRNGRCWVPCRWTKGSRSNPAKPFLVDNKRLGRAFRDYYIAGVRRLVRAGGLRVQDADALESLLNQLSENDWNVFIEPPPKETSDPDHVVKYLARYMTGGPISDRRLIEVKNDRVYFWARKNDKSGCSERVSLDGIEFMQRWTIHILPKSFTKVRCYGGWSNTCRGEYLARCDNLTPAVIENLPEQQASLEPEPSTPETPPCPKCKTATVLESSARRPSWRELFYGPDHPSWIENPRTPVSIESG